MAPDRRVVRVTQAFFDQLDQQLGPARGDAGEPSATDFLVMDLPVIVDRFATGFDDLPEAVSGVSAVRALVLPGKLVRALVAYGVLADDPSIEVVAIDLDP